MFKNPTMLDLSFNTQPDNTAQLDFTDTSTEELVDARPLDIEPVKPEDSSQKKTESIADPSTGLGFEEGSGSDSDISFEETFEKESSTESESTGGFVEIANSLADSVFGGELKVYEGYNPDEEPTPEVIAKLIEYNVNLAKEEAVQDFYSNGLSETAQRIVDFDMESKSSTELVSYLKTLVEETAIKSLSLTDVYDQETMVRTWYGNEGWTQDEIEEKIGELKQVGHLEKEATRIKPKLDAKTEEVARKKEEGLRQMKELENARRGEFTQRVNEVLKSKKIGGIALSQEEVQKIGANMTDLPIKVPLPSGAVAEMPFLEAVVNYHRYSPKGDVETLALATLLLTDRAAFEEKFKKVMQTTISNEFVKDHKYSAAQKSGQIKVEQKNKQTSQTSAPKWNLKTGSI